MRALFVPLCLVGGLVMASASVRAEDERPRLLVMNLEAASGISEDDALTLTQLVTVEAEDLGTFRTLSYRDLKTMVELEGDRATMGCTETSCLADLAGAIGARFVLYGRVSRLGKRIILQLNLIDSEAARPLSRKALKATTLGEAADRLENMVNEVLEPAIAIVDPKTAAAQKQARATNEAMAVNDPKAEPVKRAPAKEERGDPTPKAARDSGGAAESRSEKREPVPFEESTDLSILAGDKPELERIRSTKAIDGVGALAGVEATFVVDGSPEEIMEALWQPSELHEILPGGKSAEVKREGKDKQGRPWVEVKLSDKIVLVRLNYTARLIRDDKRRMLTFQEIDGDVDHVRGRIVLQPAHQAGYSIVTYRLFFDVGMMVPTTWARRAVNDQPAEMAEILRARVLEGRDSTKTASRSKSAAKKAKASKKKSKSKRKKKKNRKRKRRK